ncbi:uncharacterized protein K444DRAFT_621328 [Hyaloscypha bicolor E]|uniref:Uncharacterized protein n=1 Tax=Hyaloscypha bicolor E TaxID=1095630 RepID=A0A2J6SN30_9HELO|nr:uncharacterized protein K444DRAFT_621328 [Hyaloscypha bicolor E]PMD52187.1 hypothetical protein K444DRAFT_621328 [Hyaloscypha bicolor E]
MAARRKKSLKSSPTRPQGRSSSTTMRSERVLAKPMSRAASSRRDGEAGPGSMRFSEMLCEVVRSDGFVGGYYGLTVRSWRL